MHSTRPMYNCRLQKCHHVVPSDNSMAARRLVQKTNKELTLHDEPIGVDSVSKAKTKWQKGKQSGSQMNSDDFANQIYPRTRCQPFGTCKECKLISVGYFFR